MITKDSFELSFYLPKSSYKKLYNEKLAYLISKEHNNVKTVYWDAELLSIKYINLFPNIETLFLRNSCSLKIPIMKKLKLLVLEHCKTKSFNDLPNFTEMKSLEAHECSFIDFKGFPQMKKLEKLRINNCNTSSFEGLPLLERLKIFNFSFNQIKSFDYFSYQPNLLSITGISNNIEDISSLCSMNTLRSLILDNNNLISIEDVYRFKNLTLLSCEGNKLQQINAILKLKNLREIFCNNNPYKELHHPIVLRMIYETSLNTITVYNDGQNTHNRAIENSVFASIEKLIIKYSDQTGINKSFNEISEELIDKINEKALMLLRSYCDESIVHSRINLTFFQLFQIIYAEIKHKNLTCLYNRLEQEIIDSENKCFTGRISRLINTLSGFSEEVNINISETDQICSIILSIKNNIENKKITFQEGIESAMKQLRELIDNENMIEAWINSLKESLE